MVNSWFFLKPTHLDFLFRNAWSAYIGTLFGSTLLLLVMWYRIDHGPLIVWYATVIGVTLLRMALGWAYRHADPRRPDKGVWSRWFLAGTFVSGVTWASSVALLFPSGDIVYQLFIVSVLMGMSAGSTSVYAPSFLSFLLYSQPILLIVMVRMALEDEFMYYVIALLTLVFNIALIATSRGFSVVKNQLQEAKDKAEAANHAKSRFLANMSHEIRTPLNAVVGMAHLLRQTELNLAQKDYLAKIQSSSEVLLGLISDILDFSKIEAEGLKLDVRPFTLDQVLESVSGLVGEEAQNKGLAFSIQVDADVPRQLIGDPLRLGQVLTNLTHNAVKFSDNGSIFVKVARLNHSEESARLSFSVKDDGIGIPADQVADLFKPFSQADSSSTRRFGGTGLGLAISRCLVEHMGGDIMVKSTEEGGSTFAFTADFAIDPESIAEPVPRADDRVFSESERLRGAKVLLVEDDVLNQQVAVGMIRAFGADVTVAADGRQAILAVEDAEFDMVFMDIQMPHLDGYETTRILRREKYLTSLPIVALTAHAVSGERDKCLSYGLNDYLPKPINPLHLRDTMLKWIGGVSRRQEAQSLAVMSTSKMESRSRMNDLIDLMGREEARDLLEGILKFVPDSVVELEEALLNRKIETAAAIAHRMKGTINLYGSRTLENLLKNISRRKPSPAECDRIAADVRQEIETTLAAVREVRDALLVEIADESARMVG